MVATTGGGAKNAPPHPPPSEAVREGAIGSLSAWGAGGWGDFGEFLLHRSGVLIPFGSVQKLYVARCICILNVYLQFIS